MLIRTRLTLFFAGLMLGLLVLLSVGIYVFDKQSQEKLFYQRLQRKAEATAEVYVRKHRRLEETDKILLLTQEKQHEAIYDEANQIIYSSGRYKYYPVTARFLNRIRTKREVTFSFEDKQGIGKFFQKGDDRLIIIVTAEDTFGHQRLEALKNNLLVVNILGAGLVIALAWLFSDRSLQPVQHLLDDIRQLSLVNLHGRLPTGNGRDEMASLSSQFNHLLDRLDETVRQNQTFVTNASHELRTPLANLLGTLQVSLTYDQQPDMIKATLQSSVEEVQALIRLTNDLLLLAELGVENQVQTLSFDDFLLVEPLLDAVQMVRRQYPQYPIEVTLPDDIDCCQVPIHADLMVIALSNLMDNACKYSAPDQPVKVALQSVEQGFEYTIQDYGIGIPAKALPHLFTPLFRAENARQVQKGNGVGLALVQRIVQLHGGTVKVELTAETGTTFLVWLPARNKAII
ncbi:HAMP domain-containing sensor histidine kinase [Spirosoma spitsbergense]|uniref:HAMP domain-containing sensor histidine kinase n=1 Tax=Spirosoma spitsbergense TaxID=431554 RepID=UPI000373567D|nr:ATP-binding protein [Spirosoma spitsbergense]